MSEGVRRLGIIGSRSFLAGHFSDHVKAAYPGVDVVSLDRPHIDLNQPDTLDPTALAAFDYIANFAAISAPLHSDFREVYETNAFGQLNLLEALKSGGFSGRHLFVSTGYVYAPDEGRCSEAAKPAPGNHYGCSKLLGETYCDWFASDLDVVVARPFNCVGQGQGRNFLLPKLVAAYAAKDPVLEVGNLDIQRDFVDARDAAKMFALALFKGERGATYNVANGKATAIRDLLDLLAEVSGHNPDVRSVAKFQRAGDVLFQCGENAAMTRLGYGQGRPLKDTLSWMLSSFAAS
ncbi:MULTISPECIES: NAD-dependent epimerase/dehydratase family protein [Maricaulis]|jgi:nucleoside-diphosphate-sugar epimerase|uniref:NAD-dependent epimerase/dehydratase family protein n=1 Tax=Maricaulis TaxID=74317 RepID=UPI000C493931|nr:NAD-dependent epimerase/dehydratase family protein [Maricaulis sp.]MAC88823.1 hypothetical protein [Maricaulis sp.]